MQAIITKYLGPTDFRGSRIRCTSQAGSKTFPWDHAGDVEENHTKAALAFAWSKGWKGEWRGGALPNGTGYAFVCGENRKGLRFTVEG